MPKRTALFVTAALTLATLAWVVTSLAEDPAPEPWRQWRSVHLLDRGGAESAGAERVPGKTHTPPALPSAILFNMMGTGTPTPEQIDSFLEITRDIDRRPVLVHCRLGQQRTLLFCAVHRVFVQGIDLEQALDDMDAQGFGIRKRRHQLLLRAFHDYVDAGESVTAPNL